MNMPANFPLAYCEPFIVVSNSGKQPKGRRKWSSFVSLCRLDSKAYQTSAIHTEITIQDKVFTHLLYQFRFAYSGWRYVQIILGGESYSALADGLQPGRVRTAYLFGA